MSLQIILQARHVSYCGPWPWQICAHVGNSLMLSGESGHNISAEEHSRQFLLSNQGQRQRMRPRWQERPGVNKWFLQSQSPGHDLWTEETMRAEHWGQNLFWIFVTAAAITAWVYLFDTFCPGYWGDDLSCDRQYLETFWVLERGECQGVSLTPWTLQLISQTGNYVASKQWGPSYEAIGLTWDTLVNTRLGK